MALVLSACGSQPALKTAPSAPVVLASTPWLADITRNVAGDRLRVKSLLPDGSDPHSYQVTDLHLESLTEDPPADNYIDIMKYNVTQIVKALK
jgi:ABC-type Zn uptake system ZnuABC Zn-binding protein ZnuA